jgi:hypothetical protein
MKKWMFGCQAVVLFACEATSGELPALTKEQLMDPESCKQCHPIHYEQWSASMHAYATHDPVFEAMNRRAQEETGGALGAFCVNCHAPMAVRENAFTGEGVSKFSNVEALPNHLKGVTCYFCHNAVGVGAAHNNGNIWLAGDNVMRAAIRGAVEPTAHKVAFSSFHDPSDTQSSLMCGTCHDIVTPRGVELERTYQEHAASIQSQPGYAFASCQDCHMGRNDDKQPVATKTGRSGTAGLTAARVLHPHLWPAVDLPLTDWPHADAMRSAIESCEFQRTIPYRTVARDPGPLGQLIVEVETEAGHNFPSGATQDRRLWVELIGFDEANNELFRMGQIGDSDVEEREGQPHPCMFREYMLDEAGRETHDFHEAASLDAKGRLLPYKPIGSSLMVGLHTLTCVFRPPLATAATPPHHIEMQIRMRPMGLDVLSDLVSTGHLAADVPARMQTLTVDRSTFTYKESSREYERTPGASGDCDTWVCMIDPQSAACGRVQRRASRSRAQPSMQAGSNAQPASAGGAGTPSP